MEPKFQWDFSEILVKFGKIVKFCQIGEFQWNINEISIQFHWYLKVLWNFIEISWSQIFSEISIKKIHWISLKFQGH